jgi:hypothetical protein
MAVVVFLWVQGYLTFSGISQPHAKKSGSTVARSAFFALLVVYVVKEGTILKQGVGYGIRSDRRNEKWREKYHHPGDADSQCMERVGSQRRLL